MARKGVFKEAVWRRAMLFRSCAGFIKIRHRKHTSPGAATITPTQMRERSVQAVICDKIGVIQSSETKLLSKSEEENDNGPK